MSKRGFNNFIYLVDEGRKGNSVFLPFPVVGLNTVVGIKRRRYNIVCGDSGSGKSAFTMTNFAFLPYMRWNKIREETDIELKIYIRSLERSQIYLHAKWMCLYLYIKYRIVTTPEYLLGEGLKKSNMSDELWDIIVEAKDYFMKMYDNVHIFDGTLTPTGLWKHISKVAKEYGTIETVGEGVEERKVYKINNEKVIIVYILDHAGRLTAESGNNLKETIDKASTYLSNGRDFFHISPVLVQQFNRSIQDINRRGNFVVRPESGDLKDTSSTFQDCDMCIGLFDAWRYNIKEYEGYNIKAFTNSSGFNRFRSTLIMKNTYGRDGVSCGLNFIGEIGLFKTLPNPKIITPNDYRIARDLEDNLQVIY